MYRLNGDDKDANWYSLSANKNLSTTKKYLEKLRKGTLKTDKAEHHGGNSSKVTDEYANVIIEKLKENSMLSLRKMADIIKQYNASKEEKDPEESLLSSRGIQRFFKSKKA